MSQKAQVVIVGRMNVGKSTLFNRISRRVKSIILDYEGVTRDYLKEEVEWRDARFDLIDSGGIHLRKSKDVLFERIRKKVLEMIDAGDLILFMVDGTVGLLSEDKELVVLKVGQRYAKDMVPEAVVVPAEKQPEKPSEQQVEKQP